MRDRHIDQEQPQHAEQQKCREAQTIGDRAGDQRHRDDREGHLVDHEQAFGDGLGQRRDRVERHAAQENAVESADKAAVAGEGERVADDRPQDRDQEGGGQALRHGGEHVLLAHHAGVEQRQARDRHHQHQAGGADHPGGVGAVDLGALRESRRSGEGDCSRARGRGKAECARVISDPPASEY